MSISYKELSETVSLNSFETIVICTSKKILSNLICTPCSPNWSLQQVYPLFKKKSKSAKGVTQFCNIYLKRVPLKHLNSKS